MTKILSKQKAIYLAVLIKIVCSLFVERDILSSELELDFSIYPRINTDERAYATVAYNFNQGLGYVYTEKEDYFYFGENPPLRSTAYRPTFPVWMHIAYQKLLFKNLQHSDVIEKTSDYLKSYAFIVNLISLILFLVSIKYFAGLAAVLFNSKWLVDLSTILYILFPASLIFVGLIPSYENITLPLFVILLSKAAQTPENVNNRDIVLIPLLTTVIILLRPHMTISLVLVFAFLTLSLFQTFNKVRLLVLLGTFVAVVFVNTLILIKNNNVIGAPVLSTQEARAFYLGNNPYARGSWNGNAGKPGDPMFKYREERIKDFTTTSDELYLYREHKRLAKEWILDNPADFMMLSLRKVAMHFLPYNYEYLRINIVTFLINLGALFGIVYLMVSYKKITHVHVLLLLTVIGAFLMAIYSFFNYRYMYYIYPAFILFSGYFYSEIVLILKRKWLLHSRS